MSVSEVISNEQVQENKTDLDLSKLRAMVEKLKSTQNLLKLLFYALITFVCVGLPVLYITNRDALSEILKFVLSIQTALILFAASYIVASVINKQNLILVESSIVSAQEIGVAMNILIGRLRIELEKVKEGDKKLLPKGRQAEDFSPQVQDKKVAELEQRLLQATQHAIRARDVAEAEVQTRNDSEALREAEQNWGEMSALWDEVWGWTKEVLSEARELDNRGVVLGKLRQLDLRSPRAVIEALLRYGYLDDQEANLIGEMNSIFNSYKTGRRAVDAGALRSFKRLYGKLHA